MRTTVLLLALMVGLTACDNRPKSREDLMAENKAKWDKEEAAKKKAREGQEFLGVVLHEGTCYYLHSRNDCPKLQAEPQGKGYNAVGKIINKGTLTKMVMRNGRVQDASGFFYDSALFCETCVP